MIVRTAIATLLLSAVTQSGAQTFSSQAIEVSGTEKYIDGVVLGGLIYFGPASQNNVGVLDPASGLFTTIPKTGHYSSNKYAGAAAVDNRIYFAPSSLDNVGVLDVATSTFSVIRIRSDLYSNITGRSGKYWGAAAIGQRVYFAPRNVGPVGVVDTQTQLFSTIETGLSYDAEHYWGVVAVVRL